ncbi:ion channel [Natronorubrum sulfidifaciens]|uniref:TrkA-N domain-containing protein n=1 Tax=Natronorubrum sulfidifaciens JCM 14089 TaxID=1230460 RepID=L9WCQ1_9EURY|nr:ion channel [Natronorubrum sulfidifaciens]ELY47249.1 TrkA-N domain-containing protein [Natronorubrum sulfidifaciens JCM 14089]
MLDSVHPNRFSVRVAVWLVVAVALTSIATGVVAILTDPAVEAAGVLGTLQAVAEFSGTIIGFALLIAAWGMRRGYRVAFVAAVGLVGLSLAHGIVQFRLLSVPLVVLSVGGLVVLVATSQRFGRSSHLTATQIGALLALVGVFCYGTAGAYALRGQFDGVDGVVDAVYFTVVTASTVGYGDVHAATETGRLFAISLAILGPAAIAAAAGSLFQPALEAHLERTGRRAMTTTDTEDGDTPQIVVLDGDAALAPVIEGLARHASVTVVTREDAVSSLPDDVSRFVAEVTDGDTLERAGLERCHAVLVAGTDAGDAIAAVQSHTDATVVAVASGDSLARLGADIVVAPDPILIETVIDAVLAASSPTDQASASAASQSG